MERGKFDLERLGLRSGQAGRLDLRLAPDPPTVGGEPYPVEGEEVDARVEVSRTASGFALRLLAEVAIIGPCARCLERARLELPIDTREVEQAGAEDAELRSPYVEDGILDVGSWLHDAITLSLPEKVLCRPDCAGICEECGVSLNEVDPDQHRHERPRDPRFAKLRELEGD